MTTAVASEMPRRMASPALPQGILLAVALLSLVASAAFAARPVRTEVLGVSFDCGPSVIAGRHLEAGPFVVESRLACHDAADPWRMAALAAGLVSLAVGVATTVQLRRRAPAGSAVPPPR